MSYSKPPVEPREWPCLRCHATLTVTEETYYCDAADCRRDQLCVGCVYPCADCESDFCRDHVIEHPTGPQTAVYYCAACAAQQRRQQEAA